MTERKLSKELEPWMPDEDENGIDLDILRANLRLTPEERVLQHEARLELILALRNAAKAA